MEFVNRYKIVGYSKGNVRVFVTTTDKEPTIEMLKSFAENYTPKIDYFETLHINQIVNNEDKSEEHSFNYDELTILKNINTRLKYIVRDENGHLGLYSTKPYKIIDEWYNDDTYEPFTIYDNLFEDIKWENKLPVIIDDYVVRS